MSDQAPARRDIPWMAITVVLALLTVAWGALLFLTGGIHPQWQSDISDLRAAIAQKSVDTDKALTELRNAQAAANAAGAADRAQLSQRIDTAQDLFNTRLNGMWRQSDYVDRDAHLSRLDSVFEALRDRVRDQEYRTGDLDKRLSGLSAAPVRNPGH
jgi:hypothetical protein